MAKVAKKKRGVKPGTKRGSYNTKKRQNNLRTLLNSPSIFETTGSNLVARLTRVIDQIDAQIKRLETI